MCDFIAAVGKRAATGCSRVSQKRRDVGHPVRTSRSDPSPTKRRRLDCITALARSQSKLEDAKRPRLGKGANGMLTISCDFHSRCQQVAIFDKWRSERAAAAASGGGGGVLPVAGGTGGACGDVSLRALSVVRAVAGEYGDRVVVGRCGADPGGSGEETEDGRDYRSRNPSALPPEHLPESLVEID